jgi:excisionase family DNA binding protein
MRDLLNLKEVAKLLGISENTVYAWTSKGIIPHIKLGSRCLRFGEEEIIAWLTGKSRCTDTPALA